MMRRVVFIVVLIVLLGTGTLTFASERIKIVAGTELIADIVRNLLPEQIELMVLIPGSLCPGHYDVSTEDMLFISRADKVIIHAWQKNMPALLEAASTPGKLQIITTAGSWMVPEIQLVASKEIKDILETLPGSSALSLSQLLLERQNSITKIAEQCRALSRPYGNIAVISAEKQADFLRWLGFSVEGTYGRAEDLSPGHLVTLAQIVKKKDVRLIVDNAQSGPETGLPLAEELETAHVCLSNFPIQGTPIDTYSVLLLYNTEQVVSTFLE